MDTSVTMNACQRRPLAVALLALAAALGTGRGSQASPLPLYVSPAGNDAWSGTLAEPNAAKSDGPLATLERAREEVRKRKKAGALPEGGVTVSIAAGVYERTQTFELGAEDSGTDKSPVVYQGEPGSPPRMIGGKRVAGLRPVSDPAVLERLDPAARGKVLQADLKGQGITDYGQPGAGGIELFFQDQPMPVARWPNEGFVKIVQVLGPTPRDVRGTKGCAEGFFRYDGDRPRRWTAEKDVWLHG